MNRNDPTTTGPETARAFHGARSEDSALFRVDGLGAPAPAAAGARSSAESSGYIAVSRYEQAELSAASATKFEDSAGVGELSAASAMIRPIPEDVAPTPHPVTRGLLQGAIAAVSVALLTGVFGVAYHGVPQQPRPQPAAAPVLMELESDLVPGDADEDDEAEAEAAHADADDADDEADEDGDDRILDDEETAALTKKSSSASSKARKRASKRASKAKSKKAKAAPKPEPKPEPKAKASPKSEELPREMSVECLLNPKSCMDDTPKKSSGPSAPSEPELPSKLSLNQLKAGTAKTRDAAEDQCADLASSGDKVQVKLSIAGSTGKVVKTSILGAAAGTSLGKCVARELTASRFERTLASQQGTVVTVRF